VVVAVHDSTRRSSLEGKIYYRNWLVTPTNGTGPKTKVEVGLGSINNGGSVVGDGVWWMVTWETKRKKAVGLVII
jgi:hypothetical protein